VSAPEPFTVFTHWSAGAKSPGGAVLVWPRAKAVHNTTCKIIRQFIDVILTPLDWGTDLPSSKATKLAFVTNVQQYTMGFQSSWRVAFCRGGFLKSLKRGFLPSVSCLAIIYDPFPPERSSVTLRFRFQFRQVQNKDIRPRLRGHFVELMSEIWCGLGRVWCVFMRVREKSDDGRFHQLA
jgi:hypothetical protein